MRSRIITIDGTCGSGRETVGRKVADKLGIPLYRGAIIDRVAEGTGLSGEVVAGHIESIQDGWLGLAHSRDYDGNSVYDRVFSAMKAVLKALAREGSCVVVGCCADRILKEEAGLLTVFVHSDDAHRILRAGGIAGGSNKEIARRVRETDKNRRLYYEYYTGRGWGKTENYGLTLNSGALGTDLCAELVLALWRGLPGEAPRGR